MAARDKTEKKAPVKRKRKPRAKSPKRGKTKAPAETMKLTPLECMEYRAVLAEWSAAVAESKRVKTIVDAEKAKAIYKKLLEMMLLDEQQKNDVKWHAAALMEVQRKFAEKLGVTYSEFTTNYLIEIESGLLRRKDTDL